MLVTAFVRLCAAISPALLSWGPASPIAAEPNPVLAGQPIVLRWLFTGEKVVVSGGRFGSGTVVTGRQLLVDTPRKTTRYVFTSVYKQTSGPYAGQQARSRYEVVVQVLPPLSASCQAYSDRYGWRIQYLKGWQMDRVPLPDPANNGLFYFQKEDDSVERMAVSVMPSGEMDAAALAEKVEASLPEHYSNVSVEQRADVTQDGAPARLVTFRGVDLTHPGTETTSLVLALVRDGRAYVVSARTDAAHYRQRQALLTGMVRSIAFGKRTAATVPSR